MITNNFTFLSNDGKTAIHAVKWLPDSGEYKAILQITHGMVEFIERYAPFAEFLTTKEYMVVGHDHLGHGQSVALKVACQLKKVASKPAIGEPKKEAKV